ncbi:hypothetical protein RB195_004985 [Necator americanus]|uniref:Uncharacterized protein n=1 Tax=Necator americanus TaxID=51031 RepID=A0ABR1BKN6_NECAM
MEWVAEGHQLSDQPGATRGPGKKSLERIREEEEYKSIFNPDQTYYGYTNGVPRRKRDEYYCARFEHIGNDDNIVNIINHHPYTHISVKNVQLRMPQEKLERTT